MILMNKERQCLPRKKRGSMINGQWPGIYPVIFLMFIFIASCGVYTFHDVSIDYSKIKTVKVGFIDNKARYINPQLSPKLTDALKQKINSYTKLSQVSGDDANYQITGFINRYDVSTSAISGGQSATDRLTVGATITFINTVDNKTVNFTVSRDFDFSATLSVQQAEGQLIDDIINQLTDQIFNQIFSNW
jgi:hypothetical protein